MSLKDMWITWSPRAVRRTGSRRRHPAVELVEDRTLCALDFTSAFALAASFPSAQHVALDAAGDQFITGSFLGTANFDPAMTSAGVVIANAAAPNTFVAKYSPSGTLDWVTYFASLSSGTKGDGSLSTGIAVDNASGAIYVVGQFQGMVNFDPQGSPMVLTSSNATASDAYIVMLPASGNVAGGVVKTFGNGMGGPAFNGVVLGPGGQGVYVTGGFSGAVNFDPGGTNTTLTSPANGDALALGLTNTLGFVFVSEANLNSAEGMAIAVDETGAVAVTGTIATTHDSFIARFGSAGNLLGERPFLGAYIPGTGIFATALVSNGANFYLAGTFTGLGVNFNATTGTAAVSLDSRGQSDAFLVKLDPRLEIDWAYRFGSPGADTGAALAIDGAGNLYLTGSVSGLASFGTTGPGTVIFAPGNGISAMPNTYALQVDPNGLPTISPSGPTGSGSSFATSIAVNRAGEVAIVGFYSPPILFGTTYLQAPGTTVPFEATLAMTSSGGGSPGGSNGTGGNGTTGGTSGTGGVTVAPVLIFKGEQPIRTGRGRKQKIVGYQLFFSGPLDAGAAETIGNYQVTQPGRARRSARKLIPVLAASLDPGGTSVSLILAKANPTKPLTLTVTGLLSANNTPVATIVTRL
jgi:hypothetical protein